MNFFAQNMHANFFSPGQLQSSTHIDHYFYRNIFTYGKA